MRNIIITVIISILVAGVSLAKEGSEGMKLTSSAFSHDGFIPQKYTCQGEDVSPPLAIENIPEGTQSLALIIDDPDAPVGTWVHWVVYNIDPGEQILENSIPGKQGMNDFRKTDYGGPCPPSGTHRYFHKIYALDTLLKSQEGLTKRVLEQQMEGHILSKVELVGLYKKF